jgi:hypothetical protein
VCGVVDHFVAEKIADAWSDVFDDFVARFAGRFGRVEPRRRMADFLRSQADALLACDFFETVTLFGTRLYAFAVIEHTNRRIRVVFGGGNIGGAAPAPRRMIRSGRRPSSSALSRTRTRVVTQGVDPLPVTSAPAGHMPTETSD